MDSSISVALVQRIGSSATTSLLPVKTCCPAKAAADGSRIMSQCWPCVTKHACSAVSAASGERLCVETSAAQDGSVLFAPTRIVKRVCIRRKLGVRRVGTPRCEFKDCKAHNGGIRRPADHPPKQGLIISNLRHVCSTQHQPDHHRMLWKWIARRASHHCKEVHHSFMNWFLERGYN